MENGNRELVQKGIDILFPELKKFIKQNLGEDKKERIYYAFHNSSELTYLDFEGSYDDFIASLDIAACLKIISYMWGDTFKRHLPVNCRNWINEVRDIRNKMAHTTSQDINQEDAERDLDTMARLCSCLNPEAESQIRALYRQLRYGNTMGSIKGKLSVTNEKTDLPHMLDRLGLPSWREVIEPHKDVQEGNYKLAEFAADLGQVSKNQGRQEYVDPVEFFNRTYLTEGIKNLLIQALKRFNGGDGNPVLQLKTAFGGGKTHSLLALYHMARANFSLKDTPDLEEVIQETGFSELPHANVAVIVGTALDPTARRRPTDFPGITINTIWGDIAAQLAHSAGKPELYDLVKESDRKGVAPGSEVLKKLFNEAGPSLILMDEMVAYGRKIYGQENLPGGTYSNFLSFMQELTEAATASKNSMVVASLPKSAIEAGGVEGGRILEELEHIFGRMESIWKPVSARESFEVVKRRLFSDVKDSEKIELICNAYSQMYREMEGKFPTETGEVDYKDRMKACYPIHPQVFDKLYGEWSTLENFQRTRGVLRLMANVIHELWMSEDRNPMISFGNFPLEKEIKEELIKYLPDSEKWNSIVDDEIDGKHSAPYSLDKNNPRFGQYGAARRLSRTVFLGAPASRSQNVSGIEVKDIRLGVAKPGENLTVFDDALDKLKTELTYLYSDNDRYWYDTRPTLKKLENDRASQIKIDDLNNRIEKCLRELKSQAPFSKLHICPKSPGEVQDSNQGIRLVVLQPGDFYSEEEPANCKALCKAKEILDCCGEDSQPRIYKNMLVFLAPDSNLDTLYDNTRHLLAWKSIERQKEELNLDATQLKEASKQVKEYTQKLSASLGSVYKYLLVPEAKTEEEVWTSYKLSDEENLVLKAADIAKENDCGIEKYAPQFLKDILNQYFWKDSNRRELQIKYLWDNFFSRYLYLPKLANEQVLLDTIQEGVNRNLFAISSGVEDGEYTGLRFECGNVYPEDYLVEWSAAKKQQPLLEQQEEREESNLSECSNSLESKNSESHESARPKKFHMSTELNPERAGRDLRKYLEDIVDNLGDDCTVKLNLQMNARSDAGFPSDVVKLIKENLKSLNIEDEGFFE